MALLYSPAWECLLTGHCRWLVQQYWGEAVDPSRWGQLRWGDYSHGWQEPPYRGRQRPLQHRQAPGSRRNGYPDGPWYHRLQNRPGSMRLPLYWEAAVL